MKLAQSKLSGCASNAQCKCPFCVQFDEKSSSGIFGQQIGPDINRIVYEDDSFVVTPPLGSFVDGYLMIVPKKHYVSISRLPLTIRNRFVELKSSISNIISENYGTVAAFEHGDLDHKHRSGSCIEHAHLHILPCQVSLQHALRIKFDCIPIAGISDIWKLAPKFRYLYYERDNEGALLAKTTTNLPSQYFRRLIFAEMNRADDWDWRNNLGKTHILNTIETLGPLLRRL